MVGLWVRKIIQTGNIEWRQGVIVVFAQALRSHFVYNAAELSLRSRRAEVPRKRVFWVLEIVDIDSALEIIRKLWRDR